MLAKLKFTEELVKILSCKDSTIAIGDLYNDIWRNPRQDGGFRLSHAGYDLFNKYLKLEHYTVKIDKIFGMKTMLELDHKIKHPYYIDYQTSDRTTDLILFDSKEAMLANLYGDLDKFLDNYS